MVTNHDPQLESELRYEVQQAGERWQSYFRHCDGDRRRLLEGLRARRLKREEFEAIRLKNLADERDDFYDAEIRATTGKLNQCGGGRRNIRSTRGL